MTQQTASKHIPSRTLGLKFRALHPWPCFMQEAGCIRQGLEQVAKLHHCMFGLLKDWHRIKTRYNRCAHT